MTGGEVEDDESAAPVGEPETDGLGVGVDELDGAGALDVDDGGADGLVVVLRMVTAAGPCFLGE